MFGSFTDMFEMHECTLELYLEDKLINKQTTQAPKEMLIASFLQTAQQISSDNRPMKLKMVKPVVIWDNFENEQKTLNNEVSFSNKAMVSWKESKVVNK